MAILDDMDELEVEKNKAVRGYIIRSLAKGNQNAMLVRQITKCTGIRRSDLFPGYFQASGISGGRRLYRIYGPQGQCLQRVP